MARKRKSQGTARAHAEGRSVGERVTWRSPPRVSIGGADQLAPSAEAIITGHLGGHAVGRFIVDGMASEIAVIEQGQKLEKS